MNGYFSCPQCGAVLTEEQTLWRCAGGHCFDKAKSGYVNLLAQKEKNSKLPGDNKEMVQARRRFLESGYYEPLARKIAEMICGRLPWGGVVLDAGCGEGYYDDVLLQTCRASGKEPRLIAMDISKAAVEKAAKKLPHQLCAVGSLYHMPLRAACCDAMLNLFAPHCPGEFFRVLKPGGLALVAAPGPEHLWQLKEFLYSRPYRNEPLLLEWEGFEQEEQAVLRYPMEFHSGEALMSLFQMTPYAYKTPPEDIERLRALEGMTVFAEFELRLMRRAE